MQGYYLPFAFSKQLSGMNTNKQGYLSEYTPTEKEDYSDQVHVCKHNPSEWGNKDHFNECSSTVEGDGGNQTYYKESSLAAQEYSSDFRSNTAGISSSTLE